jgi:hypothetical protein
MDQELLDQIRDSMRSQKHTRELNAESANAAIALIASRFIENPKKLWWWESVKSPVLRIEYGDSLPYPKIQQLLGEGNVVRLIVTDDEPLPWPVLEGPLNEILHIIEDQRFFEYFLVPAVSDTPGWIIFDTHHNELVIGGSLAVSAGAI